MLVKPKKLLWGRYGKLYIVRYEPEVSKKRNAHYYLCECKCGGEASPGKRFIKGHNLRVNIHPKKG